MMDVIISGGMLIPGNISNVIASGKGKIPSRDWAITGAQFGLLVMTNA